MTVVPGGFAREKQDRTAKQIDNEANLTRGEKNGYMGAKTRSKIKSLLDSMIFLSQLPDAGKMALNANLGYKQKQCFLTFVTLTLPSKQKHDDNFIKRHLLSKLIKQLKEKYGVSLYVWVAEPQTNGNIHFHILIDKFIENVTEPKYAKVVLELTKEWNRILDLYGYIKPYQEKMQAIHAKGFIYNSESKKEVYTFSKVTAKWEVSQVDVSYDNQYSAYDYGQATNWTQPNSVDIHSLKQADNIKAYICKYMTKTDGSDQTKRKIEGRLWGCADELRSVPTYEQSFDEDLQNTVLDMQADDENSVKTMLITDYGNVDLKTFEDNDMQGVVKVFATIYTYSQARFWKYAPVRFKDKFEKYYQNAFDKIYHPKTYYSALEKEELVPS